MQVAVADAAVVDAYGDVVGAQVAALDRDSLQASSAGAVPFDAEDLAAWAVAMFDENLRRPDLARLMGWIRLEQRRTGLLFDSLDLQPKLAAVAAAQAAGRVRAGDPADLLALVVAMASAWSPTSGAYAATADEPAADHDRRRTMLRESVQRAVTPQDEPTTTTAAPYCANPYNAP
ncbi:hypothetical protein [Dactylosporangium sp. CA-139066]|uniref:hypothetical protein n=1 Tax=Dactylosporangium sp. CA-139066 TaxID=3239930 RepID=UPI003D8FE600